MATVAELYEAVRKRECILFLGAGAHYPPPEDLRDHHYPTAERPPLGAELSRTLAAECLHNILISSRGKSLDKNQRAKEAADLREKRAFLLKHRDNLQRISWFYELLSGRKALVERVAQEVDEGKKPSAVVRALAELDFPVVITTNYDKIFERALGLFGKTVSPLMYDPERNKTELLSGQPKKDERWLFKMHGCVSKLASIVITDEDYIRFVIRTNDNEEFHPVPQKLRTLLMEWPTLFVGYSLLDYNLRMLFQTLRWKWDPARQPPTFSLDLYPDMLIRAGYGVREGELAKEPRVIFIVRDIWKFVPNLYEEVFGRDMPK